MGYSGLWIPLDCHKGTTSYGLFRALDLTGLSQGNSLVWVIQGSGSHWTVTREQPRMGYSGLWIPLDCHKGTASYGLFMALDPTGLSQGNGIVWVIQGSGSHWTVTREQPRMGYSGLWIPLDCHKGTESYGLFGALDPTGLSQGNRLVWVIQGSGSHWTVTREQHRMRYSGLWIPLDCHKGTESYGLFRALDPTGLSQGNGIVWVIQSSGSHWTVTRERNRMGYSELWIPLDCHKGTESYGLFRALDPTGLSQGNGIVWVIQSSGSHWTVTREQTRMGYSGLWIPLDCHKGTDSYGLFRAGPAPPRLCSNPVVNVLTEPVTPSSRP
ncbi:UNVERIFIED_CONTAM: hypothetical protein FKN15_030866 [Acipenser sinensis]